MKDKEVEIAKEVIRSDDWVIENQTYSDNHLYQFLFRNIHSHKFDTNVQITCCYPNLLSTPFEDFCCSLIITGLFFQVQDTLSKRWEGRVHERR